MFLSRLEKVEIDNGLPNVPALSGRPHAALGRDEPVAGRSAPTPGLVAPTVSMRENPWIVGARALARGHKVEGVPLRILEAPIGPEATERNAGSAQGRLGCSSIRHPQRDMVWLP